MSTHFTPIQKIGREQLLEKLKAYKGASVESVIRAAGDDAAVIKATSEKLQLLSSDTFVEGADFDPSYMPFTHFGYKMVSAVVSDIIAMNGEPKGLLVNLALPNRMSVEMIEQLYEGIDKACKQFGIAVLGGDLTGNHQNAVFSFTVFGEVKEEELVTRANAKQGDAICVTGDIGAAVAGLRILMREKKFWQEHGDQQSQPDLGDYKFVVERQLLPIARLDVIKTLRAHNIKPSAMIDLSKGIIKEVTSLCKQSNLGAHLYQAALPVAVETRQVADEMEEDVDKYALFGGEDYELIFTLPEKDVEEFIKHFNDFSVIGRMTPKEDGLILQTAEGDLIGFDELS